MVGSPQWRLMRVGGARDSSQTVPGRGKGGPKYETKLIVGSTRGQLRGRKVGCRRQSPQCCPGTRVAVVGKKHKKEVIQFGARKAKFLQRQAVSEQGTIETSSQFSLKGKRGPTTTEPLDWTWGGEKTKLSKKHCGNLRDFKEENNAGKRHHTGEKMAHRERRALLTEKREVRRGRELFGQKNRLGKEGEKEVRGRV